MKPTDFEKKLTINEIFYSIQGESYLAGYPCIFIRLTGCDQRCIYCDTEYAFYAGKKMMIEEIVLSIEKYPCKNVLVTGGEPLLQDNTPLLIRALQNKNYTVSIETSGHKDISILPPQVIKIMDLKTPASGECEKNNYNNLKFLNSNDEIKFVVMDDQDIDWALKIIKDRNLDKICNLSMSPAGDNIHGLIADKILNSGIMIRQQVQLHKMIWPGRERAY